MAKHAHKLWIGAHTSAAGGAPNALYEGKEIGATTIQFFTSNQKQWSGRTISKEEVAEWKRALEETGIERVMSHDSYLINLGSPDPLLLEKSRQAFQHEIERCHLLDVCYLNFHPGAATSGSVEQCLDTIVESLLLMEPVLQSGSTRLLLETTAGQGTSVGHQFEQIEYILKKVHRKIPIGVCVDTCHIFVAGYDIRTQETLEKTLQTFDQTIGLEHLYAFHCNDSVKELGSRVDRHAPLGQGKIGLDCFRLLMQHPQTRSLPKYLETPDGAALWKEEIALLKAFAKENTYAH
jgi:deoxyribonuclease-4